MGNLFMSITAIILVGGLVYIILVRKIERERSGPEVLKQIRSEVDQMIVELNQTADRNIGLLEQRIRSLNELLEQTDRKIKVLQRETDRHRRSTETYSSIRPRTAAVPSAAGPEKTKQPPAEEKPKTKREQVLALYNQGISADLIASRVDSTVAEVEMIISIHEDKE